MKSISKIVLGLLALGLVLTPAEARRKSQPGPHPIKVLKIVQDGASQQTMNGAKGRYHVWLQNTTDVAVDKVQLEMELYNNSGRVIEKVTKEIGTLESGAKNMAELKYNVVGERTVKPRFWLMYNAGKEKPAEFEIDGPSWNF